MSAVQETFQGVAGWSINYPPPGRLGKNGEDFPNPFLSLQTPPNTQIYRSFGVNFEEEDGDDEDAPHDAPPQEEARDALKPLVLTRQENAVSNSDDIDYICPRCPEQSVCLSCGSTPAK